MITGGAFVGSNAYYVQGGAGTLPNGGRQTLPTGRTNNVDFSAFKRIGVYKDRMKVEVGFQAFNVLNHPQYLEGSPSLAGSYSSTGYRAFDSVNTPGQFNQKQLVFSEQSSQHAALRQVHVLASIINIITHQKTGTHRVPVFR